MPPLLLLKVWPRLWPQCRTRCSLHYCHQVKREIAEWILKYVFLLAEGRNFFLKCYLGIIHRYTRLNNFRVDIYAKIFIIRTLLLSSTAWPRVLRDECKLGIPSPGYTSTEVRRQVRRFRLFLSLCLYSSIILTSRSKDFRKSPTALLVPGVKKSCIRAVDRECL